MIKQFVVFVVVIISVLPQQDNKADQSTITLEEDELDI
jgi:hypothetical protein